MPSLLFSYLVLALLCIQLCIISAPPVRPGDVSISIDCGTSSSSYQDENLITWTGDDKYVKSGESRSVQSANSISHVMDTLRVFTTRRKNCYDIDSVRTGRVLLRASFYYGNYDDKSSPPTFDLQFDGNHWTTVETSSTEYVYHEVTYVTKMDSISVCVAQTNPGQFPFFSAIEVRCLESDMYFNYDDGYPLFLRRRVAFGSNATMIRYPDDPYDRIWTPENPSNKLIPVTSEAIFSDMVVKKVDQPPPAVLKHAVTAITPNSTIQLYMGLPPYSVSLYFSVYFSEVAQLKPNETRSLRIYENDNAPVTEPILPPYENCSEFYGINNNVSSATYNFSLVPTKDSTLPPLINAMEVFFVGPVLTNGTNNTDVQGLASLQKAFSVLQEWSGDPCLPAPYTWDWIDCSSDPTPRVTALFLGSFGLSGTIPDFSAMDGLQTIDLHNNSLKGPIPDFLGTFPDLKSLNLANNHLNGSVPASLSTKNGLNLVVTGNPDLCTSGTSCPIPSKKPAVSSSSRNKNKVQILLGTIFPFIIMLQLCSLIT